MRALGLFQKSSPFFNYEFFGPPGPASRSGVTGRRFQCSIYNSNKLFRPIVLYLGIDVHRCFAVLMTRQVLDRLRIHTGVDQVRDIGMPKKMRCHIEINRVNYIRPVVAALAEFRFNCFLIDWPFTYL